VKSSWPLTPSTPSKPFLLPGSALNIGASAFLRSRMSGTANPRRGALLKAEGVSAGVPDLCIPAWKIYIEMKCRKGGKVSPEQADYIDYLKDCGYLVHVAHGEAAAIEWIKKVAP
jgi:hypothetical protein